MADPVIQFENEVRTIVRRGSKSEEFESPIKELVGHYADIFQAQVDHGVPSIEADKIARKQIGSMGQIATQILNCASRKAKGLQIQRLLYWVPAVAALLFIGTQWQSNSTISHLFYLLLKPLTLLFILCGLGFGYGLFLSKKLLWKPIVATYLLASVILFPIFYSGSKVSDTLDGMTKPQIAALLDRYSNMRNTLSKEKMAIDRLMGINTKQFEQKYAVWIPAIENSRSGQFAIDTNSIGAFLKPFSLSLTKDKVLPAQIQLARTDSVYAAKVAWDKVGQEFSEAISNRANEINKYQFYLNAKPWPLWYVVYGAFMAPMVFLGGFGAFAGIGYLAARIQILRGEWLRLSRG